MHPTVRIAFALALLAAAASAQFAGPGLSWSGSSGNGARGFVPSCNNLSVQAVPGETVTVTVWGDVAAPFGLFAATSAAQCLPVPGLGNALVLDFPIVTVTFGVLTQTTPCLSCPPGLEPLRLPLPVGLPRGAALSLQAASLGNGQPSFTVAITGNV